MIRVLHILPSFEPGGAERMAVHLMNESASGDHEVHVASLYDPVGSDLEKLIDERVTVHFLGKRPGPDPRMFPRLKAIFRSFRPHICHTHTTVLKYALPVQKVSRTPVGVHTVQNIAEKEVGPSSKLIHRLAFRLGVRPVAVAAEVARSLKRVYGISGAPVLPNAIPLGRYFQIHERDGWRRANGFSDELLFVCVARLSEQKNHRLLLEAFAEVAGQLGNVTLLLVGDGELRSSLESLAAARGIRDSVRFLGTRSDIPEILAAADVFVMSSDWEGNPLAVIEAMAAGKVVVATAVGGTPELIESGSSGLLTNPGSRTELVAALLRVGRDPSLRHSIGDAARIRAKAYDIVEVAAGYHAYYRRLLDGTATAR